MTLVVQPRLACVPKIWRTVTCSHSCLISSPLTKQPLSEICHIYRHPLARFLLVPPSHKSCHSTIVLFYCHRLPPSSLQTSSFKSWHSPPKYCHSPLPSSRLQRLATTPVTITATAAASSISTTNAAADYALVVSRHPIGRSSPHLAHRHASSFVGQDPKWVLFPLDFTDGHSPSFAYLCLHLICAIPPSSSPSTSLQPLLQHLVYSAQLVRFAARFHCGPISVG